MPRGGGISRQQQAFEALLEPDDDFVDGPAPGRAARQPRAARHRSGSTAGRRARGGSPVFQLRCDAPAEGEAGSSEPRDAQEVGDLRHLQELFSRSFERGVVEAVYDAKGGSLAATSAALLAMSSCDWSLLPAEVQRQVYARLSAHDLALCARTSREFAAHVAERRSTIRTLILPPGPRSPAAVRGVVAAHFAAAEVSLRQCGRQLRNPAQFQAMWAALAAGSAARRSGVPVSAVDAKNCGWMHDEDVIELCATLPELRRVAMTNCVGVGDAAVVALSRYRRAPAAHPGPGPSAGPPGGRDAGGLDGGSAGGAAALNAGLDGLSLGMPRHATLARSAVEGGFDKARAAHVPAVPATAAAASSGGGGLEDVDISGCGACTDLRDSSVQALLRSGASARSLTSLNVSRLDGITRAALELNPRGVLRVLRACKCRRLDRVHMQLPPASPLEELSLVECSALHTVVLLAPWLQELSVNSCTVLATLELATPALRRLEAAGCKLLRGLGLECSVYPDLRKLHLFGCRQLETEGLESALDRMPHLESLKVNGCIMLGRLAPRHCLRLRSIDAVGCAALRTLSCPSPALHSLAVQACSELVDVRLGATHLQDLDMAGCGKLARLAMPLLEAPVSQLRAAAEAAPKGALRLAAQGCDALPAEVLAKLRAAARGARPAPSSQMRAMDVHVGEA